MKHQLNSLISSYSRKGLFIDSNLLLLLYIGVINCDFIPKYKRTNKYLKEDHEILVRFLSAFNKIVTTPNVLTEVHNLANSLSGSYRDRFAEIFAKGIEVLKEEYIESSTLIRDGIFFKFGLTDSGIYRLVKGKYLLITDDFPLSQYAIKNGVDVVSFNHIRNHMWIKR